MKTMKKICCTIFIFLLGLIALTRNGAELISILPFLYLGVFLASNYAIYYKKDLSLSYFYPSSIMVLYVSFFFFMGSLAFKEELVQMDFANQFEYYYFENIGIISFYFICAICVTLISSMLSKKVFSVSTSRSNVVKAAADKPLYAKRRSLLLSVIVIILTLLIEIPLPGGTGSFSSTFFMFAIIHISYFLKLNGHKHRIIIYALFGVFLSVFFYSDRRLLFLYGFIVCFMEVFDKRPYKIKIRNIVIFAIIVVSLITTNIAMAIHRGVGSFGSKSVIDAFTYVDEYIKSNWAKTMLFHNFEGPATMFHSYNGVNYMLQNGDYRYGLTLIKVLFLPVPRETFPDKPRSMVDEYTTTFYPAFRDEGGSYVPNFYAEAFWNFGFIGGLEFLFAVFYCFDILYFKWITRLRSEVKVENVFFLSSFAFLPFLFRGSGFDIYGLFVIIFYFMACFYKCCSFKLRLPSEKRIKLNSANAPL